MKGAYKKFDQKLFNENDPKSRKIIKDFFKKYNIILVDNEDQYGVDLLSEDKSVKFELERRLVWNKTEFPFSDVNLPERKAKFFLENNVSYIIISNDYSHIGVIMGREIKNYLNHDNLKESANKFVSKGEMFYKLPKSKFKWIKL
jgi:hypothetical protein